MVREYAFPFRHRPIHTIIDYQQRYSLKALLIADGKCAIDIVIDADISENKMYNAQAIHAATQLVDRCVPRRGSTQGGVIGRLGMILHLLLTRIEAVLVFADPIKGDFGNLAIIVREYNPHIKCVSKSFSGCRALIATIPVNVERMIFGPRDTPGSQVVIPQRMYGRK